jgi:large subunit ribosomal protein L23
MTHFEERLLKVVYAPHVSEKTSYLLKKNNVIVLRVTNDAKKMEIKLATEKLFDVKVNKVRTLIVKGKLKRHGKHVGHRNDWKKAYITLGKGQSLDLINTSAE